MHLGRPVVPEEKQSVSCGEEYGGNEYAWNVRTVSGARVPSGVYWAALEIDGQRYVSKFSVVR